MVIGVVKQIINYIFKNGMMKYLSILQESPFSDMGSVSEVFGDMNVLMFRGINMLTRMYEILLNHYGEPTPDKLEKF